MHFLNKIRQATLKRCQNIAIDLAQTAPDLPCFLDIFSQKKPAIISEVKLASPANGRLYFGDLTASEIGSSYLHNGACALSILTEPHYFDGDINTIRTLRQQHPHAHILQKDFILSQAQIDQARHAGANAILLIAGFLEPALLNTLYQKTLESGMTPIIEIHNQNELAMALPLDPPIISINNRNLQTLTMIPDRALSLKGAIPSHIHTICASGLSQSTQLLSLHHHGFDGFLIGSALMSEQHPGRKLQTLLRNISCV